MGEQPFGHRIMLDVAIADRGQFRIDPESPSGTRGLANDRESLRIRAIRRGENVTLAPFTRPPKAVESIGLGMTTGEIVPTTRLDRPLDEWRSQRRAARRQLVDAAASVALAQVLSVYVAGPDPVHLQIDYRGGRTIVPGVVPLEIVANDDGIAGAQGHRSLNWIVLVS